MHVSAQTIRNRLHEGGLRARHPQVGVVFTAQHRTGSLALTECSSPMKAGSGDAVENALLHPPAKLGSVSVIVVGGISLGGGRTALHLLARGSLTAIRFPRA